MKHLTRQKTEDTFWETKQLIVQLGFVTPRLFLQFRDYNPSINDKEEEEAIRGELDVFIEPLQLIRRDPSRDLAMIDLGPYYFMERGLSAMHPPVQSKQIHPEFKSEPGKTYLLDPKQPLDRANFYRYYLGARFICQHVQDGNLDGHMVGDPLFVRMDSQTAIYLEADWT